MKKVDSCSSIDGSWDLSLHRGESDSEDSDWEMVSLPREIRTEEQVQALSSEVAETAAEEGTSQVVTALQQETSEAEEAAEEHVQAQATTNLVDLLLPLEFLDENQPSGIGVVIILNFAFAFLVAYGASDLFFGN
ncbi:hypothetical protein [Candidatus Ichthyocystis hellenicum]|uniref:hypothetical protein n=1 Tax=Candidatus Ichthyocystis hellenicum TaxID=1561003 RepID=UPI000B85700A|nr:hypothetical protein [Candidatus Ichthyocystis hellenicum]